MKFNIPGAFWVALVGALVPVVQNVIVQFYPEADYWWSALLVTGLAAIAKSVQIAVQGKPKLIDESINADGAALPAAAPMVEQKSAPFLGRLLFE